MVRHTVFGFKLERTVKSLKPVLSAAKGVRG